MGSTLFKNFLESETVRSEGPAVMLATDGSKCVQSHINKKKVLSHCVGEKDKPAYLMSVLFDPILSLF